MKKVSENEAINLSTAARRLLSGYIQCQGRGRGDIEKMIAHGQSNWVFETGKGHVEEAAEDGAIYLQHGEMRDADDHPCWIPAIPIESEILHRVHTLIPYAVTDDFGAFIDFFALNGDAEYDHRKEFELAVKLFSAFQLYGGPAYFDYASARNLIRLLFGRPDLVSHRGVGNGTGKQGLFVRGPFGPDEVTYWYYEFCSPFLTFAGVSFGSPVFFSYRAGPRLEEALAA